MAGLNLFSPRMPKRLTPVYLPAWIFDAEIEAIGTSQVPQQNPPQTLISRILLNSCVVCFLVNAFQWYSNIVQILTRY